MLPLRNSPLRAHNYNSVNIDSSKDLNGIKKILKFQNHDNLGNHKDWSNIQGVQLSRETSPVGFEERFERLSMKKYYIKKYIFNQQLGSKNCTNTSKRAPGGSLSKMNFQREQSMINFKKIKEKLNGDINSSKNLNRWESAHLKKVKVMQESK